jgi:tetratricopeptide (TPR) repeat protein
MTDRRRDPDNPERPEAGEPAEGARPAHGPARRRLAGMLQEIDRAAALLGELLAKAAPDRRRLVDAQPRFHALKLCDLLLERAREAGFTEPAEAVEAAELAVAVADRLDATHYGGELVEDSRARSWAHLANALRIGSDLRRAEEAFAAAEEHHRRAGEDAYTGAEILALKASLRIAQGRHEEAAALLDPAIQVYREARDRHREGKALIQKGAALTCAGRHAAAARVIRRGLGRIDLYDEPRLLVAARHNLMVCLKGIGRPEEALRVLEETRGLYLELGERSHLVRLRWMEGKIFRDLGRADEAETAFREVRQAFVEQGIGLEAGMVSLDLAMVLLERGEAREIQELAAEMIAVFESRGDQRKALAAFALLRQAAEAEQVSLAMLQEMAATLEQARRGREGG